MRTIYIDSEFKCHITNDGTMTAVETEAFNGKCDTYIEGCRYIPAGESWTRSDGVVFTGTMIAPFKDSQLLEAAQKLYEEMNASAIKEERIAALEEENAMLMECILEMSEIVYA
jgi:hypothetical protein